MKLFTSYIILVLSLVIFSCNAGHQIIPQKSFTNTQTEVKRMMDSVSKDIAANPAKWLQYFEDTSAFYMASEGKLVFPNYNTAKNFVNDTLVHAITKVNLQWSNVIIDSLNENTVAVHSNYHEDLSMTSGNVVHEDGYCTAIAHNTNSGWKFISLHWSVSK